VRNPVYEIPKGRKSGGLHVVDQAALAKATNSNALNKFVTFGSEPLHLATNRSKHLNHKTKQCFSNLSAAALPSYSARQSIRELKKAAADNKKLLAKLASSKSSALLKAFKSPKTNAGSPSGLKREVSDSEDYTDSSDDDSEYTDDEEDEPSPLPASRPDEPHEAVRYDIIKASWYPRRSALSSDQIKNSMRDLWEVLSTIQKRWRADSKAVTDAEEQKMTGELPVLKSRVASQRDLLQSALKAGLDYAHPDVLYHLGQVKPFLYLCYQFLANRFKAKDYDGALPSVIYEMLAQCGTLTTELIEETKVSKALVSMKKNASDKNKEFIQKVVDGAAAGSKKAKTSSPPAPEPADAKTAKRPAPDSTVRPAEGPLAKKSKPAEPAAKTATLASRPTPAASAISAQKRPGDKPAATPAPIKARVNQVANKSSSIFASLNAASKKPAAAATAPTAAKAGAAPKSATVAAKDKKAAPATSKPAFSFAQTMASLTKPKAPEAAPAKSEKTPPNETPEEKAKRLRKESRRHLRVTFRPDASLVAIKYFSHDPEEEMGHDANFVRDAGDIGGEGHMFKQHKELDVDEEDEDNEVEFRPWIEPSMVDFSVVDPEERKRNYMPYGGGEAVPTCPEKEANMQRENTTLMVFYAHPSDIPASPAEPSEQSQDSAAPVNATMFGAPPDICLKRAPQTTTPAPTTDFSNLENIIKQFSTANSQPQATAVPSATYPTAYPPPAPAPAPAPAAPPIADLASLLSTLQGTTPFQPQATQPALPPMPVQQAAPPSLDFNAIMSALQSGNAAALPPPPPGLPPGFPPGFPFAFPPQLPQQESAAYQAPASAQPQYNQATTGGTKRPREDSSNMADRGGYGKKQKGRGDRPHKVLACKFYSKGTCNKGDNCTYIHDMNM
jgi:hypothetical protein